MDLKSVLFRETPVHTDTERVKEIIESSGFFSPQEIDVARELVQERLAKGVSSGYFFLFAEAEGRVVGYACYGPIPCTVQSFDLYWIAVEQSLRGTGLGRELLQRSEQAMSTGRRQPHLRGDVLP